MPLVAPTTSKRLFWTGVVVSALPVLMLLMSAVMKFFKPAEVIEGLAKFGWDEKMAVGLGIVELACTALYVIPQTAVLGAILLTGYLGGATATHLRIGDAWPSTLTPVVLGIVVWLGLYLRDARVRGILPLR